MKHKKPNLVLLFGAGASHDCFVQGLSVPITDLGLCPPPLVNDLFLSKFAARYYPVFARLDAVASDFFRCHSTGKSLEQYLSILSKSADELDQHQFLIFVFYLQHLFSEYSLNYLGKSTPSAYHVLAQTARDLKNQYDKVTFLTLNYDLLLDQALESVFRVRFQNFPSYVNFFEKRFSYVKLHGSVNWSYMWPSSRVPRVSLLDEISAFPNATSNKIQVHDAPVTNMQPVRDPHSQHWYFHLPVLSVPIVEKAAVPVQNIRDALSMTLADGPVEIVSIGYSCRDDDVSEILKTAGALVSRLTVVDRDQSACDDVLSRFRPLISPVASTHTYCGFSSFASSGVSLFPTNPE